MRIEVDQEACIGAASCVAIAGLTFALNQEGKVYILNEDEAAVRSEGGEVITSSSTDRMDARDVVIEAARSCPVFAIKLFEDDGTEIVL
jgi:ferredoxin